jgi:prepilin-type N-terminal cleavage/methylation domain-containing protein
MGFTLIELLVVIAIIILLAAIAIPVVGRMQRGGQTATSTGNLRQIHMMVMNFVGEHSGKLPRASYPAGQDPNGLEDGTTHYWRRVVWESQQGSLGENYQQKVINLTKGGYSKVMWCPLQVSKNKKSQIGFLEGHGSYSINKFFFLWDARINEGDGDVRAIQEMVRGKREPLIVAGTPSTDIGTGPYFQSTKPPVNGKYETVWHSMVYDYGSSGGNGLALFLDGGVRLITPEEGKEMSADVSNHKNFE